MGIIQGEKKNPQTPEIVGEDGSSYPGFSAA